VTTTQSTIYSRCPSCHKDGLVQPVQASYRCALCNYDYVELAKDQAALEAWMLENLRLGGFSVLWVLFLHRVILSLPVDESRAQVLAFAARHGIEIPKGFNPLWIVAIVFGGLALLLALIAVLNRLL
jgi:hypothetical protein